jgi:hypothetical protein
VNKAQSHDVAAHIVENHGNRKMVSPLSLAASANARKSHSHFFQRK